MSDYKRKKQSKFSYDKKARAKKGKVVFDEDELDDNIDKQSSLKIVKGKRIIRRHRIKIFFLILLIIAAAVVILSVMLPVSLSENINNLFATIGSGTYPVDLSGNEVLNAESKGAYYYVLTDTNITAINRSGAVIYNTPHGYSKPVLKSSQTRALVFDQGGADLSVFNLSEKVNSYHTDAQIITAAISRDGIYAVATTSNEYTSVVEVYDRRDNLLYKWNSARDIVNNVAISSSGKKIAVSTVNGVNGELVSHVYVLGYDSADYKYHIEINDSTVMSLDDSDDGFTIISGEGYSFVNWDDFSKTDYKTDFMVDKFRKCADGSVMVLNRENDRSDNKIIVFDKDGVKKGEFDYSGLISDIRYEHSHIYCINESKIMVFETNGNVIADFECGYGNVRVVTVSTDGIIAFTDNEVSKYDINS